MFFFLAASRVMWGIPMHEVICMHLFESNARDDDVQWAISSLYCHSHSNCFISESKHNDKSAVVLFFIFHFTVLVNSVCVFNVTITTIIKRCHPIGGRL